VIEATSDSPTTKILTTMIRAFLFVGILFSLYQQVSCYTMTKSSRGPFSLKPDTVDKSPAKKIVSAIAATVITMVSVLNANALENKVTGLSDAEVAKIVFEDTAQRQALITADFTRSIYSEDCTFQDEVSTYKLPEYIKGTKALFNPEKSHVDVVDGSVETVVDASNTHIIKFRFKETLAFNIPFNPKVDLTGRVEIKRGPQEAGGLIVSSREFWDKSVADVVRGLYF
jgi:hypothetical protein